MPTVRVIGTDALFEIGVLGEGETMSAAQGAVVLRRFQAQIDSWAAIRLTLAVQTRTSFTLTSGSSSFTLGPTGADVTMQRPVWINTLNYIIPGSSPEVEVPIGLMDQDAYANTTIKELSSALPLQAFYQTSLTQSYGTLFVWPQVSQDVDLAIYTPQAVGEPTTLDSVMTGPPGYREAFMYQLAIRLMTPFGKRPEDYALLVGPTGMAARAFDVMQKPNIDPGQMGVDAALVPTGGGYNVYSDTTTAWGGR